MKIPRSLNPLRSAWRSRSRERGSAVIVVLVCLALVFAYLAGNARTLHYLGRELKLIERQQTQRLAASARQAEVGRQKAKAETAAAQPGTALTRTAADPGVPGRSIKNGE